MLSKKQLFSVQLQQFFLKKLTIGYIGSTFKKTDLIINLTKRATAPLHFHSPNSKYYRVHATSVLADEKSNTYPIYSISPPVN